VEDECGVVSFKCAVGCFEVECGVEMDDATG